MAISTATLTAGYTYSEGFRNWVEYGLFSLLATFSVYNGQRLLKSNQLKETPWLLWVKRNEKTLYLLVVCTSILTVIVLYGLINLSSFSFILILFSGLLSLFYVLKINGRNLREIPHVKIHLISLTWALLLIVFPLINEGVETSEIYFIGGVHYIYVLAVTIPFDIRDLKHDLPSQRTIPQVIGVNLSKLLSIALLLSFGVLMVSANMKLMTNPLFYLAVLLQVGLVIFMNQSKGDIYCAGLIDGTIVLLGLSYFF